MKRQNWNILLFVDNAPSHLQLNLSNVSVKFFPPTRHPKHNQWIGNYSNSKVEVQKTTGKGLIFKLIVFAISVKSAECFNLSYT
jgi:hypothetical protein